MAESAVNEDFRDLLRAFLDADVRFLVVGAYALAVHGRPRATGDLDIWIEPTAENAGKAYGALTAFGAPLAELTENDLTTPGVIFQIGVVPRRIDVLTDLTGICFADAWPRRIEGVYGDLRFPVIGRAEFLTNKRATGRPKDLVDADALEDLANREGREADET